MKRMVSLALSLALITSVCLCVSGSWAETTDADSSQFTPVVVNPDGLPAITPSNTLPEPQAFATYIVFPVVMHTAFNKSFSDLPVLMASTVANQLQQRAQAQGQPISVLSPVFSFDQLRDKGLDRVYRKMIRDYLEAGRPLEDDIYKLADSLTTDTQKPEWAVFVEADLDIAHTTRPSGMEWIRYTLYDRMPRDPNVFILTHVKVFRLQDGMPVVWERSQKAAIKYSNVGRMTGSVFDIGDVYSYFRGKATDMSTQLVGTMPLGLPSVSKTTSAQVVRPSSGNPAYKLFNFNPNP